MKVTKIHYFFTAPNNMYWQKIGMEAEIIEGDDVRQCLYELKKQVETFFYESKAAAEKQMGTQVTTVEENSKPKSQEETIIEGINSCTEMNVLLSYSLIVKNNPQFKDVYDIKMGKLNSL